MLIWSSCKHDQVRLDVVSCPVSWSFCLSSLWLRCAVWAHSALRPVLWNVTSSMTTGRVERQKRSDCFQGLQVFNETQEGIYGETHMDCTLLRRNHCPTARTRQQWGLFEFTVTKTNVFEEKTPLSQLNKRNREHRFMDKVFTLKVAFIW